MICKVKNAIESYSMPLKGKTVAVGVSGGADSMALLNVLLQLREEYKLHLVACHVNHGIRGESAGRDECFVKAACQRLGVEFRVLHADIPTLAVQKHLGIEDCGRQVRYEFFNSVGENAVIATAHTLSDRCETLLFNITRGTSVKGLRSIPPVRDNIVRPLIDCTRAEIEAYCAENEIDFVTDETNFEDIYSRNRIRLNVLPELKKLNPNVEEAFCRLIKNAECENDYLDGIAREILGKARLENGFDAVLIKNQHKAVRQRVIFKLIKEQKGIIPEAIHIEAVEAVLGGGKTEIIGNTVVKVKNGALLIDPVEESFREWEFDFSNLCAKTPCGTVEAKIINKNNLQPKQFVHNKVLDYSGIVGSVCVRNRRPGDKMRVAGSSCTKSLKKLFNEKKLKNRNNIPILADEKGILWVRGIGCADRCKITDKTENILIVVNDD